MRMQKQRYDEGKPTNSLDVKRIRALEAIGFAWAKRKGDFLWDQKYQDLLGFKETFGHCNVPIKWSRDRTLGRWVSTQRKEYKSLIENKRTLLTQERLRKLEDVGFQWVGSLGTAPGDRYGDAYPYPALPSSPPDDDAVADGANSSPNPDLPRSSPDDCDGANSVSSDLSRSSPASAPDSPRPSLSRSSSTSTLVL